jgi:predicted O-linked N-acetylglucosamine transferase (SPINDLY family)
MRILKSVDESILWLFEDNAKSALNLKNEAEKRGVNPDRIYFAKRVPLSEHLARQKVADLFLDTWPCNAHTTTSDALWAGLPVLTFPGESFASRVAASLVNAVGLTELIAGSEKQYEELAIELAKDSEKLNHYKKTLLLNLDSSPLFDTNKFTINLENLYIQLIKSKVIET